MSGDLSSRSPGDPRRRIGARVRISHLVQSGRREELDGVVVSRRQYGVNVRLTDGTIRSFSDVEVSPAEPGSPVRPAGAAGYADDGSASAWWWVEIATVRRAPRAAARPPPAPPGAR